MEKQIVAFHALLFCDGCWRMFVEAMTFPCQGVYVAISTFVMFCMALFSVLFFNIFRGLRLGFRLSFWAHLVELASLGVIRLDSAQLVCCGAKQVGILQQRVGLIKNERLFCVGVINVFKWCSQLKLRIQNKYYILVDVTHVLSFRSLLWPAELGLQLFPKLG